MYVVSVVGLEGVEGSLEGNWRPLASSVSGLSCRAPEVLSRVAPNRRLSSAIQCCRVVNVDVSEGRDARGCRMRRGRPTREINRQ